MLLAMETSVIYVGAAQVGGGEMVEPMLAQLSVRIILLQKFVHRIFPCYQYTSGFFMKKSPLFAQHRCRVRCKQTLERRFLSPLSVVGLFLFLDENIFQRSIYAPFF